MKEQERRHAIRAEARPDARPLRAAMRGVHRFCAPRSRLSIGRVPARRHRGTVRPFLRQDHAGAANRRPLQESGGAAAWIDADRTFDPATPPHWAWRSTGCRWRSRIRRSRPWRSRASWRLPGRVDLLVVDSAAALVPRTGTGAAIGESGRDCTAACWRRGCASWRGPRRGRAPGVFLNQTRSRHGSRRGEETSAGGPPLKLTPPCASR